MNKPDGLLIWLDGHPPCYAWLATAVIATATAFALFSWLRSQPAEGPRSDWKWGLVLLAVLAVGRWPSLIVARELNPDESQLFAGAHALTRDPVFWRSVDGHTAGPLDFFCLVPSGWIFGWDSYLGVRLTALALLAVALTFVHQCLALVFASRVVRLATLSAAVFEALTNSGDFLHYSTELLPMVCLGVAAYAAVRRWVNQGGPEWSGLGGLMLGAVPMSKLQPAPLALVAGLYWAWAELRASGTEAWRHRIYLAAGAVLPSLLFVFPVLLAEQGDAFVISYLRFNLGYAASGNSSWWPLLKELLANSLSADSLLHLWLPGTLAWCAIAFRPRLPADRVARQFTFLALVATAISLFCVLHAGRPFLHYWQLFIPPCTLLLGALLGDLAAARGGMTKSNRWLMAVCTVILSGALVGHRLREPNDLIGILVLSRNPPRTNLSEHILAHARPGEQMAVWGWSNFLYVETGLFQATREAHIDRLTSPGPYQEYLRERYLVDFMVARPAMFVDSVGPSSRLLNLISPVWKHDRNYPMLAAVIRRDYVLVDEADGAQIYRRRDLVAR